MLEVAALTARSTATLRASGFWTGLRHEVVRLSTEPSGARLAGLAETVEQRYGEHPVRLGGWHGDWGRWNMDTCDGVVQIWDWERYDPEVPCGFDAVHYAAQSDPAGRGDAAASRRRTSCARCRRACASWVSRRPSTTSRSRLYLLEIAAATSTR